LHLLPLPGCQLGGQPGLLHLLRLLAHLDKALVDEFRLLLGRPFEVENLVHALLSGLLLLLLPYLPFWCFLEIEITAALAIELF